MRHTRSLLILLILLLCLCACKNNTPAIVGSWNAESSMFNEENSAESIHVIFYDGMEGEERHETDGTTKSYQFDYETDGTKLTVYVGETQTVYTIQYGESNGTETIKLTAEDGTVYAYTLSSRTTPGIRH